MGNKAKYRIYFLFLFAVFLAACGSTKITCPDPRAEIYMDDEFLGTGEAKISSIGFPHTANLEAKKNGKVIGTETMSRHFTLSTLGMGFITYYTGWLWAWYYPDDVIIQVYYTPAGFDTPGSVWDLSRESIWMKPINKGK